jgi:hypothetical protein
LSLAHQSVSHRLIGVTQAAVRIQSALTAITSMPIDIVVTTHGIFPLFLVLARSASEEFLALSLLFIQPMDGNRFKPPTTNLPP